MSLRRDPPVPPRVERTLAPDHPVFAGHFPGRPVVPAVVLLDEVLRAAGAGAGAAIVQAKFLRPVAPGERFAIALQRDGARVRFVCSVGAEIVARGVLADGPGV